MVLLFALGGAAAGGDHDEEIVAAALSGRAAELEGAHCPEPLGGPGLREAAGALRGSISGSPVVRADAIYQTFTAIVEADARAEECRKTPGTTEAEGRRALTYRAQVSPHDVLASDRRLRAWGDADAAAAWRRLASVAATPRHEADDPEICRCMGEPIRGVAVLYGYPTAEMELLSLLGEATLGGCDPTAGGPLACPLGCWADRRRVGEEVADPRRVASRTAAGLLLGLAGDDASVAEWDRAVGADPDLGTLEACMDTLTFGQAYLNDGTWHPAAGRTSDRCLAAWAEQHVPSGQIDRAAVMRQ